MHDVECLSWIFGGVCFEEFMQYKWFQHIEYDCENDPDHGHRMDPPELEIKVSIPAIYNVEHVKSCYACQ